MYLSRLHSALGEVQVAAPRPSGVRDVSRALEIVEECATRYKNQLLSEQRLPTTTDLALITALRREKRSTYDDEGMALNKEVALRGLTTYFHAKSLLLHEDVALAARLAALIDETLYKERLLEIYTRLDALR
jgi:hypothetical protein